MSLEPQTARLLVGTLHVPFRTLGAHNGVIPRDLLPLASYVVRLALSKHDNSPGAAVSQLRCRSQAAAQALLKSFNILYAEGRELLGAKSYEAAIAKFNQLLGHDPYHSAALQGRADAFDRLGHAQEAERSRRRASVIEEVGAEYELGEGD